jgi:hypothetical protein
LRIPARHLASPDDPFEVFPFGAPRRRALPVEEDSTQRVVD